MNSSRIKIYTLISFTLVILFACQNLFGQETFRNKTIETSKAELVDSYLWSGADEASARIDYLRQEMNKQPNSRGLIVVYCGKVCQYGEVEAHLLGIRLSLKFKAVDEKKFSVISGGFREKTITEFWVIPENACPPIPNSTIDIKEIKFKGTYKRKIVPYECC